MDNERVTWEDIAENITKTAEEVVGFRISTKNNRPDNPEVEKLSKKQKDLRLQISTCDDPLTIAELKAERNKIMHKIKEILTNDKETQINEKVAEIDKAKDATKMFKAVQELSRKKFENPFVHDEKGRKVTNPQEIYTIIHAHFKKQFSVATEEELEPFDGPPRTKSR